MSDLRLRQARFAELTPFEVYGLCRLRVDVFVVEQECPYPELDGRDLEPATVHLWFESDGEVAATIRVLDDGDDAGDRPGGDRRRLPRAGARRPADRGGHRALRRRPVTLGAQAHLEGWYERFGFRRSGPGYVEDGIPHVPMRREPALSA